MKRPPIFIAGCGYVGQALALQAIGKGMEVAGICRSGESARVVEEAGIPVRIADLADVVSLERIAKEWPRDTAVVHCAAGGRGGGAEVYRTVYLEGMRNLRRAFPEASRWLFTSSTSVYAQTDGSVVTEESPAEPDRETGRILRQTEEETLADGGMVVRLAGIYGPGRSVLLRNFLTGEAVIDVRTEPPATPDGRWVNQIHREDAAAALLFLLTDEQVRGGMIYNTVDSTPMLQRTIYAELARRFARPLPAEVPPDASRKRGWTHKRVDAARLRCCGWSPRFPSWFDALDGDEALVPSVLAQLE
ncbi:MAG TPA: NAD-dependent epimerase/dehydratase family protein [Verrucomicrobiales bacterium]|nr:NAD-dependent epimerase/dehydratase family protein [Verrucomicrobiales bacterium]